jgi:hypothetical protein
MAKKPAVKKPAPPKSFHIDKRAAAIVDDNTGDPDDMMSPKETAAYLGVSEVWLSKRRWLGDGPPYEVLSPHVYKYRRGKLNRWLEQRSFTRTNQYARWAQGRRLRREVLA